MRRVIEDLIERRKNRQDELKTSLNGLAEALEKRSLLKNNRRKIREGFACFQDALEAYVSAQDKEWDAYANNHATTVFKSLQWKIEKLEAEYSNLKTLLIHFAQLENKLDRLLETLDGQAVPTPLAATITELQSIKEQLSPLQYADFEKRFRGSSEEISGRLGKYLSLFSGRQEILDIGCGRGEFLALLKSNGQQGLG
ncbi:MAG: hypothetical protein IH584_06775, partial [Candidatus Aminicenantes bacterium]|nr:hypothetical protein [Candidatus Aminicenantes bacterium]